MKASNLFLVAFFLSSVLIAQQRIKFKEISSPVKWWVISHPFFALKAMKVSSNSRSLTKSDSIMAIFGNDGNGGGLDAFRHAFWMASLSEKIGNRRTIRLGIAHEKGNRKDFEKKRLEDGSLPDKVSIEMDLHNNAVGVSLTQKKEGVTQKELISRVYNAYLSGELVVVKKDKQKRSVNVNGEIILPKQWQGKWENTRVLVPSNCN